MDLFDVLPYYVNNKTVYRIRVNGKEKLAKFEGMQLWLRELQEERMLDRLLKFHEIIELPDYERERARQVSNGMDILFFLVCERPDH